MDGKKRICLMLSTFFVLLPPSHFVHKAQADWYNNHGPVSPPPDVGPPECVSGCNGGNNGGGDTLPPGPSIEGFVIAVCAFSGDRSEEHTSELQSHLNLV